MDIELFGVLQQAVGADRLTLADPDEGATVAEVLEQLAAAHPSLVPHLPRLACAQGDELIRRDATVDRSRALVLLPPVSGG